MNTGAQMNNSHRGFGSLVWSGVFSTGYSQEFATLMRECCQSLMAKFSAACRLDTGSGVFPSSVQVEAWMV